MSARHHDGVAASIVRSIKYRGRRDLAAPVGRLVADAIRDAPQIERGGRLLIVTWVPSVPLHRRERGYDVGALIAHAAARSLGTVAVPTLRRSDSTGQTGKSRQQRLDGPNLRANLLTSAPIRAFAAEILLIDDVMTTGTSLARAAFVLGSVGVSVVLAATFTSVHDHVDRSWLSLPGDAR